MIELKMTEKEYSELQRWLGIIWGAADALEDSRTATVILDAMEQIEDRMDKATTGWSEEGGS